MIVGIVLAAGRSSRLGRPKHLLPVNGEPLLRYTLRRILASSLARVIVVIGPEPDAIREAIADLPVDVVVNPDAALGQSTSVATGIRALGPETKAVVMLLGDQPGIDPAVVDALTAAWRESGAPVVAPRYEGGIGNPILFDRSLFPALLRLRGDTGARSVVRAHEREGTLQTVTIAGPAPPDIDTEADYAALLAALAADSST